MATLSQRHYPELPEAAAPPDGGLPLRELLTVLRRRRRVVFWVVALLTSIATLMGLQITPTYTATALVMIEPRENRVVDLEQVVQGLSADAATIETQIRFIQSRENLGRVVDKLNLRADPDVSPPDGAAPAAGALSFLAGWLPEGVAERLPDKWLVAAGFAREPVIESGPRSEPSPEALREKAAGALQGGLKVAQSGWSYVLSVSYTSTDPDDAARIANGVADAYVEGRLDQKLAATRRASSWLAERVDELRERVLEAEEAVEEYRGAKGLVGGGPDGATLDAQQLAALTAELIDARAERTTREARLRRVRELWDGGNTAEALAEVLSSPLLMSLRQRELDLVRQEAQLAQEFGARHPQILQLQAEKQRIADRIGLEVGNAIRNLEHEVAVARSREQALQESLNEAKGHSALSGQAGVQLRQLEREAAATRSLYETFLLRLKETEEQQQILQADARVISPAKVPGAPSSRSPKVFAAVGFTASVVLGSILALLLEQLDGSLRSGRQVEQLLQVPALGLVPKVTELGRKERLHGYLIDKPRSAFTEGVRALYTQVRLADVDRPPKVILVTSALPGEGKTSLAASLAAFAAQLQQRTLLIDLDLRRPCVGREFDVDAEAGIVEVVGGETSLEDAVCGDRETGVDVLAVAHSHSNPTALVTSQRLAALLRLARERYDCVIIDTPPVLGVTDAKALSPQVDALVFVVQWERTKQDAAQAAVKELKDVGANVVGAVLNQVDMKRHAYYGYGDAGQYYRRYSKYYAN